MKIFLIFDLKVLVWEVRAADEERAPRELARGRAAEEEDEGEGPGREGALGAGALRGAARGAWFHTAVHP